MKLLQKIRNAYYGKPIVYNPGLKTSGQEEPVESRKNIAVSKEPPAAPTSKTQQPKPPAFAPGRGPSIQPTKPKDENFVRDENTFLENLAIIEKEILGKDTGKVTEIVGNVTKDEFTFLQNLEAVSLAFLGKGTGPGEVLKADVTNDENTFVQNLDAVAQAYLGQGTGAGVIIKENVTDPSKDIRENLQAIAENFQNVSARQTGQIDKRKSKK